MIDHILQLWKLETSKKLLFIPFLSNSPQNALSQFIFFGVLKLYTVELLKSIKKEQQKNDCY